MPGSNYKPQTSVARRYFEEADSPESSDISQSLARDSSLTSSNL